MTGFELPPGENLAERARAELAAAAGHPLPARIRIHKRIPPGSGLGGGSSDAAATLRALARVHALDSIDLQGIAARLGADVPFLLCGGAATATGAGDRLTPEGLPAGWFAVAWPGYGISTAAVYEAYDRVGGAGQNHLRRAAETVEPRLRDFARGLGDDWQMSGSGSAFFRACASEAEARAAASGRDCWTAVARPVGPWC